MKRHRRRPDRDPDVINARNRCNARCPFLGRSSPGRPMSFAAIRGIADTNDEDGPSAPSASRPIAKSNSCHESSVSASSRLASQGNLKALAGAEYDDWNKWLASSTAGALPCEPD